MERAYIKKVSNLSAVLQGKLAVSAANLKTWFVKGLSSFDHIVNSRLEKVEVGVAEIRAMTTSACGRQRDSEIRQREFEARLEKKMQAMDRNMNACLQGLRVVDQKVASGENSQILADVRTNLARVQKESVAQARREGELKAKVEKIEMQGGDGTSTPPPVKPPCVTPMADSRDSGQAGRSPQGPSVAHAPPRVISWFLFRRMRPRRGWAGPSHLRLIKSFEKSLTVLTPHRWSVRCRFVLLELGEGKMTKCQALRVFQLHTI